MEIVERIPQPQTDNLADHDEVAKAVADAQVVLRYAAQNGIELPADIVAPLMKAKAEVESGRASSETAVAFYGAYAKVAAKIAPVTIDTLNVPEKKTGKQLKCYGWSAVVVAALIVIFSIVTFITNSMSSDIWL